MLVKKIHDMLWEINSPCNFKIRDKQIWVFKPAWAPDKWIIWYDGIEVPGDGDFTICQSKEEAIARAVAFVPFIGIMTGPPFVMENLYEAW